MLETISCNPTPQARAVGDDTGSFCPVEKIPGSRETGLLLVCDHASNILPPGYGTLGLSQSQLERHIGYDIGVETVTRTLAEKLGVPAILACYSRLLIDPNRGEDDPTLVAQLSDDTVIPGNVGIGKKEIERRMDAYYLPYHQAITDALDHSIARRIVPAILSIHSFTPYWRGVHRPWHASILWDTDRRFPGPLIEALKMEADLIVGDNEPYTGELEGDTMNRHGTQRGLAHALLEIRQDQIADDDGAIVWAERLARLLAPILQTESLFEFNLSRAKS